VAAVGSKLAPVQGPVLVPVPVPVEMEMDSSNRTDCWLEDIVERRPVEMAVVLVALAAVALAATAAGRSPRAG
jgi:hypothetical protein